MGTPFKLRNGMLLLSTEAPGGIYNSTQLKKIAALCDGDSAIVKATEDQRIALLVTPAKAKTIAAELKAVGLGIRNYQDGLHQPTTCIGELCGDHLQDAMGSAMDLTQALTKVALSSSLKIGINGCARCCVPTHTLDISVIGDSNGYRINLGGKNSQIPEMATFMAEGVPAAKLAELVTGVVGIYKELAEAGESLQDVMERCGVQRFVDALAPFSQDAHGASDPFGDNDGAEATGSDEMAMDGAADELALDDALEADELAIDDGLEVAASEGLAMDDGLEVTEEIVMDDGLETAATEELAMDDGLEVDATEELAMDDGLEVDATEELAMDDGLEVDATEELAMDDGLEVAATEELAMDDGLETTATEELVMDEAFDSDMTEDLVMDEELPSAMPAAAAADDLGELAMDELAPEEMTADDLDAFEDLVEEPAPVAAPAPRAAAAAPRAARKIELSELSPDLETDDFGMDAIDISPAEFQSNAAGATGLAMDVPISAGDDFDDSNVLAMPAGRPDPRTKPEVMAEFDEPMAETDDDATMLDEIEDLAAAKAPSPTAKTLASAITDDDLMLDKLAPDELSMDEADEPVMIEAELMADEDDLATAELDPGALSFDEEPITALEADDVFEEVSLSDTDVGEAVPTVMAVPAAAVAAAPAEDEIEDDFAAPEVAEDEADAFEEKLNASIAEEEAMPESEDFNSLERAEAMRLIELPGEVTPAEAVGRAETAGFGDLGIEHDDDLGHAAAGTDVHIDADHGNVASMHAGGFEFSGFDFTSEGKLSLRFASGASINLDPASLANGGGNRSFTVAGSTIHVRRTKTGTAIEVDGVEIVLPSRAA